MSARPSADVTPLRKISVKATNMFAHNKVGTMVKPCGLKQYTEEEWLATQLKTQLKGADDELEVLTFDQLGVGLAELAKEAPKQAPTKRQEWPPGFAFPFLEYKSCFLILEGLGTERTYNCVGYTMDDRDIFEESTNQQEVIDLYSKRGYVKLDPGHKDATIDLWCNENEQFAHATTIYRDAGQYNMPVGRTWASYLHPGDTITHGRFEIANSIHFNHIFVSFREPKEDDEKEAKMRRVFDSANKSKIRLEDNE